MVVGKEVVIWESNSGDFRYFIKYVKSFKIILYGDNFMWFYMSILVK